MSCFVILKYCPYMVNQIKAAENNIQSKVRHCFPFLYPQSHSPEVTVSVMNTLAASNRNPY